MVEPQEVVAILVDKSATWHATALIPTPHPLRVVLLLLLHEVAMVAGFEVDWLVTTALPHATSAVDPTTMPVIVRLRP